MGIKSLRMAVVAVGLVAGIASAQSASDIATWDTNWAAYQALEAIPLPARGYVTTSQDLTIVINAKAKDVFDIYSNVYNALGLHPFLTGITPIRHTSNSLDFIAYENIPLPDGTVFPGVTIAQQRFNREHLYYDADTYDYPGIVTHQHITFTKIGKNQTQVTEHLTFEATPDFIGLAAQGGIYAHYVVQQGLKAKIEAGQLRAVKFPKWLPRTGGCGDSHNVGNDDDNDD
jgi:hypothetical protein